MATLHFRALREAICTGVGNVRSTRFSYAQRSCRFGTTADSADSAVDVTVPQNLLNRASRCDRYLAKTSHW